MKHSLEISGCRLFFDERMILSDIYLKMETGKIIGLLGHNGCGKSCLLRGIFGTLAYEKSVYMDGISIYKAYQQPHLIRYLPHHHFIPKSLTLQRIFRDFSIDFTAFAELFPDFQNREKARVDHLSSGMHRLVEIYIILKSETQFILLDEPFTHISPIQMSMIESIITSEAVNKGFLITDHMYRHIRNICTPIYLLSDGKTYLVKENDDLRRLGYLPSE